MLCVQTRINRLLRCIPTLGSILDSCHAAFRCQNLLAPDEARESLSYISEHGFNNGVDCAAMPAIAAWDHYITTGDIQLLYEMLPGIIKYAEEADARYDEEMLHDRCLLPSFRNLLLLFEKQLHSSDLPGLVGHIFYSCSDT